MSLFYHTSVAYSTNSCFHFALNATFLCNLFTVSPIFLQSDTNCRRKKSRPFLQPCLDFSCREPYGLRREKPFLCGCNRGLTNFQGGLVDISGEILYNKRRSFAHASLGACRYRAACCRRSAKCTASILPRDTITARYAPKAADRFCAQQEY